MTDHEVEVLAIGAGPANLALATALEELASPGLAQHTLVVERHPDVKWQRDLLLPWARSQVSFLKDLATLRNPRSKFSFLNYMHSQGRLDDFVNMATFHPYRSELSDYLQWVANSLDHVRVRYGASCERVTPCRGADGAIDGWLATLSDGTAVRCRDIVIGTGRDAHVPNAFAELPRDRWAHSSRYRSTVADWPRHDGLRVVVIGGAQSAAEMFRAVHDDLPGCLPTIVLRSIAFQNYQTSKFVNQLYYPSFVDSFFDAGPDARRRVLDEMRLTNYAGLAPPFVEELYSMLYQQRLRGDTRSTVIAMSEVVAARMDGDEIVLDLHDRMTDTVFQMRCDRVLLGTGYRPEPPALVRSLLTELGVDGFAVSRDYRLLVDEADRGACYLQGINEQTHGISDSLISVLAHRSQNIVDDLTKRRVHTRIDEPLAVARTS